MGKPSSKPPFTRLVYDGAVLSVEFYVTPRGDVPAEE